MPPHWSTIIQTKKKYTYKDKNKIPHWTKECKYYPVKDYYCLKTNYRVITDYGNPSKIKMQRKMETDHAQKIYKKKRSKTAELPFAH